MNLKSMSEKTTSKNPATGTTSAADDFGNNVGPGPSQEDLDAKAALQAEEDAKDLAERTKAAQVGGTYLPPKGEEDLYHVKMDKPGYNPKDGKKVNRAFIQKFNDKDFVNIERNAGNLGYEIKVLWNPEIFADPEAYAAKVKAKAAKAAKEAKANK